MRDSWMDLAVPSGVELMRLVARDGKSPSDSQGPKRVLCWDLKRLHLGVACCVLYSRETARLKVQSLQIPAQHTTQECSLFKSQHTCGKEHEQPPYLES